MADDKPNPIDAKIAAKNEAAAEAAKGAPVPAVDDAPAAPVADPRTGTDEPAPVDFLDQGFKAEQAGAHPVDLSPAEVVASAEAAHTVAKGLSADGATATGLTIGDRVPETPVDSATGLPIKA